MSEYIMPEVAHEISKQIAGEVRLDPTTKLLYSTDASIYQIEPLGVVFPRTLDDLSAVVEIAARHKVPILPRGAGSSLAGQAVGRALVIDCMRHLNKIIEIDPEAQRATVEPGVVLGIFNRRALKYGLQYGPDPASADRATFGGVLGNNATGAHSIAYGMAADHMISSEVILADGSQATFGDVALEEAQRRAEADSIEGQLYRYALRLRAEKADLIREHWPRVWRRASGYNLNYLMAWSGTQPPRWDAYNQNHYPPYDSQDINFSPLLVGSEGTLGVYRTVTVRLVRKPKHQILGVLAYDSIAEACDAAPKLLDLKPTAIELIPRSLIQLARTVPAYAAQVSFVQGDPAALLVVEFSGDDPAEVMAQVKQLGSDALIAESAEAQNNIWAVRKVGLGLLMSRAGDVKPQPFIEDVAVPVERLGEFVRGVERILESHGITGDFYAHASAGCLHIRPLVNMKTSAGVSQLREIMQQTVALVFEVGGVLSGEHGDGIARGEWLEQLFGAEITHEFQTLKAIADPHNLLNPGKLIDPLPMDRNLRYGAEYKAKGWEPVFDFSRQDSLEGAIEMCNGAGVCLKEGGVMCPSFQATHDEMHSTRGRSNLLRALISGRGPAGHQSEKAVREALDLCLECKGCKSECPSSVDVAKLKYEFLHHYYSGHARPLRDYLFGYIGSFVKLGHPFAFLVRPLMKVKPLTNLGTRLMGLSDKRKLPVLALHKPRLSTAEVGAVAETEDVILLSDAFSEYFYPELVEATHRALKAIGCNVYILPVLGAGRTLISKGFLDQAKRQTERVVAAIFAHDPEGKLPVVGIEPSEILTFRDEFLEFLPNDERVRALAERSFMLDEFMLRPDASGESRMSRLKAVLQTVPGKEVVHLHGHCYQKALPPAADGYPVGVGASAQFLRELGYDVEVIDSGCCGMAGSFGYEAKHYDISMQIGESRLFPAVRAAGEDAVVAPGVSCRGHIEDGTGQIAQHPVMLLDALL